MGIVVRAETAADAGAIAALTEAAFLDAGHASHTEPAGVLPGHVARGTVAYHGAFDAQD